MIWTFCFAGKQKYLKPLICFISVFIILCSPHSPMTKAIYGCMSGNAVACVVYPHRYYVQRCVAHLLPCGKGNAEHPFFQRQQLPAVVVCAFGHHAKRHIVQNHLFCRLENGVVALQRLSSVASAVHWHYFQKA